MKKQLLYLLLFLAGINMNAQNGIDFNGSSNNINCGNDTSLQISGQNFTIEAWINPSNFGKNVFDGNVICKEDNMNNYGYMLRVGGSGSLNFVFGNGTWHEVTTAQLITLNNWQHIAGSYDGSKLRVYVNGVAVDSSSFSGSLTPNTLTDLFLGASPQNSRYYSGKMDEVKIWTVCRSANEIQAGMSTEMCGPANGLKAYYKFNQGKAGQNNVNVKTLTDISGYYNKGTLNSFALNGNNSNWVVGKTMIKPSVTTYDTISVCERLTSPSRKFVWNKSGQYYDTLSTYTSCDSILSINLTIKKTTYATFYKTICDSMISPSGNFVWKKSGIYSDKIKNVALCDSSMTFYITKSGSSDTITRKQCYSYLSPYGKTYTKSGFYRDTIKNHVGCDSILSIHLTINSVSNSKLNREECGPIISPSGKYIWSVEGQYFDTLVNYTGCDSIIEVTYKSLKRFSTTSWTNCSPLQSPSGKRTFTTTGIYIDTIATQRGCDSIMTINFTRLPSSSTNQAVSGCRSYISPNGTTYTSSQVFTEVYQNYLTCDSTVVYTLTIISPNTNISKSGKVLTAASPNGQFQWLNCDNNYSQISGETAKVLTVTATGNYAVEVNNNNCKDTSECLFVDLVGIYSPRLINFAKLSPNPSNNQFKIEFESYQENVTVEAFDLQGKSLLHLEFTNQKTLTIPHELNSGMYFIRISSSLGVQETLLIVEH